MINKGALQARPFKRQKTPRRVPVKSSFASLSAFQPSQIRAGTRSIVMGLGGLLARPILAIARREPLHRSVANRRTEASLRDHSWRVNPALVTTDLCA